MRVVGLDLSLTSTGIAVVEDGSLTELHNVKSTGKKGDTLEQRQDRLYGIANDVCGHSTSLADDGFTDNPDLVVIEAPSYGSRFGSAHDRSGLWWLVVNALMSDGVPVAMVSPQGRAKYGTGAGNSKKDVVVAHVMERYSDLAPRRIKNDDECDAILLASMGARHLGSPVEIVELPESNLAAMGGVAWPAAS